MTEFDRAVEATLFASAEPLSAEDIAAYVGEGDVAAALAALAERYAGHGIELVERGGRWHFQTAPDLAHILRRTREEPRRLSRAATETLAIIAYHEPVSRAEIEAIRGVQISQGHARRADGGGLGAHRGPPRRPGRPLLYATTPDFLTHFGLGSRRDLPGIDDLKAAGLLDPLERGDVRAATGKRRRGGLSKRQILYSGVSLMGGFSLWHILIFAIIVLLLFGGNRFST